MPGTPVEYTRPMKGGVRIQAQGGAWRLLSVQEAVVEASQNLDRGDPESALRLLEQVVKREPHLPAVRYLIGVAQVRQKSYELGISNLQKAVQADAGNVDYLVSLGNALMAERPRDAIPCLSRAAELGSLNPGVYADLAVLLFNVANFEEALRICDLGITICGPHPRIVWNRGVVLEALSRIEESLECLQAAHAQLGEDVNLIGNIGKLLRDLGRLEESRSYLERAVALAPGSSEAHRNLGLTLLLAGDYGDGFRENEWRWGTRNFAGRRPDFPQPAWDGRDLEGRRILLYAEQRAGDVIQFVRYVDFARARNGRVILWVPQSLVRLMAGLPGCEISAQQDELPEFDVHCALLSLPHLAETVLGRIPPPASFVVPPEMKRKWRELLGRLGGQRPGKRAGIVWAGSGAHPNDRNRSFACRLFEPLLDIPDVQWFSRQVGPAGTQLAEPGIQGRIVDLAPDLTDYAETAAAISQLDLVISADTSVAHLAGSLGAPVWMLTPFAPDWRWLLEREDSPWYPSMRLFRQKIADDWGSVFDSVAVALRRPA